MHQLVDEYLDRINLVQYVVVFSLLIVSIGILTGTLSLDFSRSHAIGILYEQHFENGLTNPTLAFTHYCANASYFNPYNGVGPKVGNYSFKFSGTDDCNANNSYVYYKIADRSSSPIPIGENTILEYKIAPQNTFGQNVGVDLKLLNANGTFFGYLRDQDIYSDDAVLMHPALQSKHTGFELCCPLSALKPIKVNLGKLRGKKISEIIVGYDDNYYAQQGSFDARIDDIKISDVAPFRRYPLGNRVITSASAYIKKDLTTGQLASATKQASLTLGTVIDGPVTQSTSVYWKIDFDSGPDGWIGETSLHPKGFTLQELQNNITRAANSVLTCATKGDVDCSGGVTVTDGVTVLKCAAGLATCNKNLADMDCNYSVTVTDGANVLRKAAGLSVPACISAFPQDATLTCNTESSAALPTTDSWMINGTNVGVRLGVNRNFGGIGVELSLINQSVPANAVNVIESRSGAGAGWQTSYWAHDVATNRLVVINQAAGNSAGMQWGMHNSFLGMNASSWNLLNSDHYYPSGTFDHSKIATSPCSGTSYAFDYGKLALDLSKRVTTAGTAIQISNQYTLHAKVTQNFSEWALEQAFYLDRKVAFDHNLRVYLHGRSGWSEGPILPWKDFSVVHGSGSCNTSKCEYAVSTDIAYGVFVWNINGRDIGIVVPANTAGGFILGVDKLPYCGDSTNLRCGNIALHNYLNIHKGGYQVDINAERTYGVNYTIGTIDELKALGYTILK